MWHFRKVIADLVSSAVPPLPETPADDDPAARGIPTRKGTVLWFDQDKAYGRIRSADGGGNIIVYQSTIERSGLIGLVSGQEVEFDLVPWGGYHVRAENLRLIAACAE